tara:strand:+ start:1446 stop:1625 length:180 start_codon:yes stop_codon:yes gene_type:complete
MNEEDSKNLRDIKELLEEINRKTTTYMDAKLKLIKNETLASEHSKLDIIEWARSNLRQL